MLIDQQMVQNKIAVEPKEIDAKLSQVKEEIQKQGGTYAKVLEELSIAEQELRQQIEAQLRWDRYVDRQAGDKQLRDYFQANRDLFDGSTVHARHILLSPDQKDAAAVKQAKDKLLKW